MKCLTPNETGNQAPMKTYLFYSCDARGNDVIIPIQAMDRDGAFAEFDFIYGVDTPIDMCIEAAEETPGVA